MYIKKKHPNTIKIINDVYNKFITTHEAASGFAIDSYQKGVILKFIEMLAGIGTTYRTNLLTRFRLDGTVLFPLAPTNDNDAYLQSFEIDLISGEKMGEYVNMDSSHITVQGALPDASGQYFEVYKSMSDYALEPGYIFAYTKQANTPLSTPTMFGDLNNMTALRLRPITNAWTYYNWNGASAVNLGTTNNGGQAGVWKRASGPKELWSTHQDGTFKIIDYNNDSGAPTGRSLLNMRFHSSHSSPVIFPYVLSMYGMGIQFTENEDTAFNDLSQAIRYYQENIISNDTRRWI